MFQFWFTTNIFPPWNYQRAKKITIIFSAIFTYASSSEDNVTGLVEKLEAQTAAQKEECSAVAGTESSSVGLLLPQCGCRSPREEVCTSRVHCSRALAHQLIVPPVLLSLVGELSPQKFQNKSKSNSMLDHPPAFQWGAPSFSCSCIARSWCLTAPAPVSSTEAELHPPSWPASPQLSQTLSFYSPSTLSIGFMYSGGRASWGPQALLNPFSAGVGPLCP